MDKFLSFLKEYKIAVSVGLVLFFLLLFGNRIRSLFRRGVSFNPITPEDNVALSQNRLTERTAVEYAERVYSAFHALGIHRSDLENIVDFLNVPPHRAHNALLLSNAFGSRRNWVMLMGFGRSLTLRGWINTGLSSRGVQVIRLGLFRKWDDFLSSANL